jgi:hypothetical protein
MPSSSCPARFPVGTKYVVKADGLFVRRHIEFPDGRKLQLSTRKALTCTPCIRAISQQVSIVPDEIAGVVARDTNIAG